MKKFLGLSVLFFVFFFLAQSVDASYVNGYYRRDGTYVRPHYRSNPNGLQYDNYSYRSGQSLFNDSYYKYDTYKWRTPSYSWQNDYYTGLNSYNYFNSYRNNSLWDY